MNKLVLATASAVALCIAGPGMAQTTTPTQGYQGQPSTYGQTNAGTPSYQGQPSTSGQTNAGTPPSYQGQPSTSGQTNAGTPPSYRGQPSTYGQANTGMPGSYGQPSAAGQTAVAGPADVQQIQEQLRSAGLYRGRADGQMGPATRRALARFQRQQGLRPTGVPDQQTLGALTGNPTAAGSSMATPGTQPSGAGTSGAPSTYTKPNTPR